MEAVKYLISAWLSLFTRERTIGPFNVNREARRAFEQSPLRSADWATKTTSKRK